MRYNSQKMNDKVYFKSSSVPLFDELHVYTFNTLHNKSNQLRDYFMPRSISFVNWLLTRNMVNDSEIIIHKEYAYCFGLR